MELHKIKSGSITKYVLLDDSMHLIQPVNRYLEYLRLRGRAENTLKAYGQDLKAFFIFLKRKGLSYEKVDAAMIQEYVEYLRSTHEDRVINFKTVAETSGVSRATLYENEKLRIRIESLRAVKTNKTPEQSAEGGKRDAYCTIS